MGRRGRVPDDSNAREPRNGLLKRFQGFDVRLGHYDGEPRDVAARPREAGDVAAADRIRVAREYYGNRRGLSLGRLCIDGARRNDDIDLEPDQFLRQGGKPVVLPLAPPILDRDILALDPTPTTHPVAKTLDGIREHGRT